MRGGVNPPRRMTYALPAFINTSRYDVSRAAFLLLAVRVDHQQISEPRLTIAVPCQKDNARCELRITAASKEEITGIK